MRGSGRLQASLQQLGGAGERAVILLPSGINYAVAFYACLYSGVIAVPAYPPEGGAQRYAGRLNGILRDATPRFVLTEASLRAVVEASLPDPDNVHIIEVDAVPAVWRRTGERRASSRCDRVSPVHVGINVAAEGRLRLPRQFVRQ